MMMKHMILIPLLATACLAACSSDDEQTTKYAPRPMTVDVAEHPIVDAETTAGSGTSRAAEVTTTATLSRFSMNYQDNKYDFTKSGSGWNTHNWPNSVVNDAKIDFYAYTRGTFSYGNGNPYVSFTVESEPGSQHDLLVAEHKQIAYSDAGGHVSLTFDHACAAVLLNVQITSTLRNSLSSDLTVNSIVLKNVNNQGHYDYATKSWSNLTGSASYTLTNSAITVTTTPQQLSCGYLFMIPQKRAKGAEGIYLEVNYTTSRAKTATIPLDVDWQAGKCYNMTVRLGTNTISL
jgi:hypothetical protein